MADNTTVAAGGGDNIRDVDRGNAKTQVVVLDAGGAAGEALVDIDTPLPVSSGGYERVLAAIAMRQLQLAMAQPTNGFVPIELPTFLGGL